MSPKKPTLTTAKKALKEYFGYESFHALQKKAISSVLAGQDTFVLMPTGGGKSMCFQIPAVIIPGTTIVVSPLIALMKDQVDGLKANGIAAEFLNSSLDSAEQSQVIEALLAGSLDLLYVSAERLVTAEFMELLKKIKVNLFAIDEAHCISSWGHDFRPEYTQLSHLKQQFPGVPIIALTATADRTTREDILTQLELDEPQILIDSFDRPNISLTVLPAQKRIDAIREF
ncbi:RecQ family ATP-dependent DNA helicase [Candidatus Woesebacteria bacterium]|nr:RecQ family ATP-dependent DNA helicase [Candidatus Woesebacteria bacterium]